MKRFKTIKMFQANGAWYAATNYSAYLLVKCGLPRHGGYLSFIAVKNHAAKFNIRVEAAPK